MPSAPTSDSGSPRRRGEQTAERILDVAEELFAERGYAATTLRDVAERVGVRTPSLYNHFESKESLYAAVLERGIGPVFEILADYAQGPGGRDSAALIEQVMGLLTRRPNLARLVHHETLSGGQHLTPMLGSWIGPVFARAQEVASASPAAGRWKPEQIPLLVLAMYHVVLGFFTIAPLYRELTGEDLASSAARARQTRFLQELTELLLPDEPDEPDESEPER